VNATNFWPSFKWLLMQALSIVYLPVLDWILLLLGIGLIVSAVRQKLFQSGRWKWYYSLILTQSLFVGAVISVGVLYAVTRNPTQPLPKVNPVADWTINICFFLSLVLGSFWVYRMKGIRWFAFCLVALQELFLLSAMFIAGISITGDWL
jgi:hypothetical protein